MAKDVSTTVNNCEHSIKRWVSMRLEHRIAIFPRTEPVEFIVTNAPDDLTRTRNYIIADWYSKLTQEISTTKRSASYVATSVFDYWIIQCGIPSILLVDIGPQFAIKSFQKLGFDLSFTKVTTAANRPEISGQTDPCWKTLDTRLSRSISDHQKDSEKYVQPLIHAYNTPVSNSRKTTYFRLVRSRQPPSLSTVMLLTGP